MISVEDVRDLKGSFHLSAADGGRREVIVDPPDAMNPAALRTLSSLSLIHISEPTRLRRISYAVFCLKKKKNKQP